ncbi:MAG: hypothetical protein MJ252_13925 [archaeon]|nr:hypothetical protein [archaeon]
MSEEEKVDQSANQTINPEEQGSRMISESRISEGAIDSFINEVVAEADRAAEDLFAGGYEKFVEKSFYGDPEYEDTKILPSENFNSEIIPKRKDKELYRVLITRAKENFEAPIGNLLSIKHASDEATAGNNEVKGTKTQNEYPLIERPYVEMGFQTPNMFVTKSFQVAKKAYKNQYTQVENKFADIQPDIEKKRATIMKSKLDTVENFLIKVRPLMEQALQSNETINIFMNDFELDKYSRIQSDEKRSNTNTQQQQEIRTYRDNSAGNKNKKEKSVNVIRVVAQTDPFIAITMFRNLSFTERAKIGGIPYESKIIFWNVKDIEQNSPIFEVGTDSEVTTFEFDPSNPNNFACALISGQIMFVKFKNLMETLRSHANTDFSSIAKKINKKDYYQYKMPKLSQSHQGKIRGLRWLTPGYCFGKKTPVRFDEELKESGILASLGEDGQIILWDFRGIEYEGGKTTESVVFIKNIPIEINKVDSIGRIAGTGLEYELIDGKFFFFASNEEGRTYYVDMSIKVTQDNLAANVTKYYYNRYFRPVLFFQKSPFFDDIFLTVHDFHFCLWCKERSKPILIGPNLKKSSYTCGKFSPSRPGVIYLCRTNGKIDIWDFLDESHKASVKDSYIKETITSIELFRYQHPEDENEEVKTAVFSEYLLVGDNSGQMSMMEVPKLFSEPAQDEIKIMREFFDNEIKRQNYMDGRYKALEERINAYTPSEKKEKTEDQKDFDLKWEEDEFMAGRNAILEELGIKVEEEHPEEEKEEEDF